MGRLPGLGRLLRPAITPIKNNPNVAAAKVTPTIILFCGEALIAVSGKWPSLSLPRWLYSGIVADVLYLGELAAVTPMSRISPRLDGARASHPDPSESLAQAARLKLCLCIELWQRIGS